MLGFAVRFELRRLVDPARIALCSACLALAVHRVYGYMGELALAVDFDGATAFDMFYLSVSDGQCTGLYYPLACLVLCGDMFSRDEAGGMGRLLLSRGVTRRCYWLGKMLAAIIACTLLVLATGAVLTIVDAVCFQHPLSFAPPEWLSYAGDMDWFLRVGGQDFLSPIPQAWNYPLLIATLVFVEGICLSCFVLAVAAVSLPVRGRMVPLAVGISLVLMNSMLPMLYVKLRFLLDPVGSEFGVAEIGLLFDRFCVGTYALGAGFFQTHAGGAALAARELASNPDVPGDYLASIAEGYRVNDYASLVALLTCLLSFSCICFHRRYRVFARKPERGSRHETV